MDTADSNTQQARPSWWAVRSCPSVEHRAYRMSSARHVTAPTTCRARCKADTGEGRSRANQIRHTSPLTPAARCPATRSLADARRSRPTSSERTHWYRDGAPFQARRLAEHGDLEGYRLGANAGGRSEPADRGHAARCGVPVSLVASLARRSQWPLTGPKRPRPCAANDAPQFISLGWAMAVLATHTSI